MERKNSKDLDDRAPASDGGDDDCSGLDVSSSRVVMHQNISDQVWAALVSLP